MNGGLRQSMAWLHTWTGLPVGWVIFFVFLTGTLGYFDSEIDRWMRPETPLALPAPSQMDGLAMGLARLDRVAPRASRWTVFPPSGHDVPNVSGAGTLGAYWQLSRGRCTRRVLAGSSGRCTRCVPADRRLRAYGALSAVLAGHSASSGKAWCSMWTSS